MEVDIDYVLKHGDPRLESFPLMQTPTTNICLVILYLLFVKVVGPWLMRDRQPFQLRMPMLIYNVAIVGISLWMFIRFFSLWAYKYNLRCPSIDYSNNDDAILAMTTFYVFYVSKLIEFLDTIFFVLRKKDSQITLLHVFHHVVAATVTWYSAKYTGGGYATILPTLNVFVHIWMYLYYGLSAMGPSVRKYLWWKKYITIMQLIQFVVILGYVAQMLAFPRRGCNIRSFPVLALLGQGGIFLVLFLDFYFKTYIPKKQEDIESRNHSKIT